VIKVPDLNRIKKSVKSKDCSDETIPLDKLIAQNYHGFRNQALDLALSDFSGESLVHIQVLVHSPAANQMRALSLDPSQIRCCLVY